MVRRTEVILLVVILFLPYLHIGFSLKTLNFGSDIKANPFVVEGSKIRIFVDSNGEGVEGVNISIIRKGIIEIHAKTNSSGYATIHIPYINFSVPCKLIARKYGYSGTEMTIWLTNRPKLYIVAPKVVEEGKNVTITVIDNNLNRVEDAVISIGGEEAITDDNGSYVFRAPDVGIPIPIEIYAEKSGYEKSDKIKLWILDNRTSNISSPLWIYSEKKFHVQYTGDENVKIYFNGEYRQGDKATFFAPNVNRTKTYQINIYDKNGTILDYRFVVVVNRTKRAIIESPYLVKEKSKFNIHLLSLENLSKIPGIEIEFDQQKKITDKDGSAEFLAPEVEKKYKLSSLYVLDRNISTEKRYVWIKKPENLSLVIHGPSTVQSGKNVTFNITDVNGKRIFAVVTFVNLTTFAMNGTTRFRVPNIEESKYVYIKAKSPGYAGDSKLVYIIGTKKRLVIDCNDSIGEGKTFYVKIRDQNGNPVDGVDLWFNFREYISDSNGNISITAPDVLLSTRYLLYAEKDGYLSASKWITVVDRGLGKRFMDMITPLEVKPWQHFEVRIIDAHGEGIKDVNIEMRYLSMKREYKSDDSGYAYITAPPLAGNNYFVLTATKKNYVEKREIIRLFEMDPTLENLSVHLSKSTSMEGEDITLQVKGEHGEPVEGANIWIDDLSEEYKSDKYGVVTFKAPPVDIDKSCFIYATKEGYNPGHTWIEVIKRTYLKEPLRIKTNSSVYEGSDFTVKITDRYGKPVPDVDVWFDSIDKRSNNSGIVIFRAPFVDKDTYILIGVKSDRYAPSYGLIKVLDRYKNRNKLNISSPPRVMEGRKLTIVVRSEFGYVVENATVMVNGEIVGYTDRYGRITIDVPNVDHDILLDIIATKAGYESDSRYIEVKNRNEGFIEANWFIIPLIALIFLIAIFAYFYYRQYKII